MNTEFRKYQKKADEAIFEELQENNKCLVKMFCGTGKSKLMRYCSIAQNKKLIVYVVPSLSLLEQFYTDYLQDFPLVQRISCEQESTTDSTEIIEFLKMPADKIICITYQSFETLIHLLGDTKIDVCIFDEAHHVVGKTYQTLIFDSNVCEKQIFFTATPKNANGVIMYDKDNLDVGMCGKLVYDYSYFKGVMEGYLNPFEIRIDFYTENVNTSVYEAMARAILASSNSRVLTFHADVNGDRDASVLRFVDETLFTTVFNKVLETEFPEKIGYYKKIQIIGLSAEIIMKERKRILTQFDKTLDNEIFIISSCQTIGEGIDTKSANMCVFVDPKSSFVSITQNIGRIVRKIFDQDKPNSTILIPCWVDKEKYLGCDGDKDKCDEVIREDMNKEGNFNGILNVMSALKQEDEELFDACLNYPSTYSPQEIEGNLSKHGYQLEEPIKDGLLVESLEHMLETDINFDEDETDEELLARTAEENNVAIEVHSNSLETPIEYYGQGDGKEVIRIFKSEDEEIEETIYQPITTKDGTKRNTDCVEPLRRENRFNVKVHTNPDVKVLWNLKDGFGLSKDICSCIIDCEVVDIWPQRFEELKAFIDANEKLPDQASNKGNILGKWFSHQLQNYKNKMNSMKNNIKYNLWAEFTKKYKQYLLTNDDKWFNKLGCVKLFIDTHNKKPSITSPNKNEAKLGLWISNQRKNYKHKTGLMNDETKQILWMQFLEEYKECMGSYDDKWFKMFEELKIFITKNKKLPSKHLENTKLLGKWLSTQQNIYRRKLDCMKDEARYNLWSQFLEEYKEYFISNDEKWFQKFEELKTFINENKRQPSTISKNLEENKLGDWLSDQQKYYKKKTCGMKDEVRYKLWTQFLEEYKEYFDLKDKLWFQRFEELKIFISINKKKPSAKKETEKQLGNWLETQKKTYKNKTDRMKDEEQYNLWTQFLEEYKEYFVNPSEDEEAPIEDDEEIIVKPKQKKTAKLTKINPEKKVETKQDIFQRTKPLISQFHNKFCKMRSDNLAQHFQQNPSDFAEYHRVRDECFQTFEPEDIPCERIIQELEKIKKGGKHVVDMGCGTAKIAQHFRKDDRFQITSYDHVAINDTVQVCDISHMPLEDGSVDMCIMSLALWGSNCDEYIREALRVLDENGILYIIDSTKRWSEEGTQDAGKLKLLLETNGFQIKAKDTKIDKWCYFKCMK
jgi:superfamily II DNA or RNA helicase/SAM-dependent methyltransferase